VGETPAAFEVVQVGECIEYRIDVGGNMEAEVDEIVRGIDHDGKALWWKDGGKPARQLATAHAAG
jgi:hypothetical protein